MAETQTHNPNIDPSNNPVLQGLPIEVVGQVDPLKPDYQLGFPHVLYHGTKADTFVMDDTRTHRESQVGTGARTGNGIYMASEAVSKNFGEGTIIEFIPHNAHLIDLEAPEARQPLSPAFKAAYMEDFKDAFGRVAAMHPDISSTLLNQIWDKIAGQTELASTTEVNDIAGKLEGKAGVSFLAAKNAVREIASQISTARLISQAPNVSLQELFGSIDSINGKGRVSDGTWLDFYPIVDFLTKQGVDGAQTIQRFNGEQGVVFWKLDKVGDRETWMRRRAAAMGKVGLSGMGKQQESGDMPPTTESVPGMDVDIAANIRAKVASKGELAPTARLTALATTLESKSVAPYDVVKSVAESSPELYAMVVAGNKSGKGYRLHEYMQAALGQFENEFAERTNDPKEAQLMRMALLLKNIGKTTADALGADDATTRQLNLDVARTLLRPIDETVMSRDDKLFVSTLVGQNIIADRVSGKTDEMTARKLFLALERQVPVSHRAKLRRALTGMYMCATAAYTSEATFTKADGKPGTPIARNDGAFVRKGGHLSLVRYRDEVRKIVA